MMRPSVAIIGGGVAGLTAGFFLEGPFKVSLFEKTARLGGNAYTFRASDGEEVDIAAAVFGRAGYPNFFRLLGRLGVEARPCPGSFMSFHDLERGTGLYMTATLGGLLSQQFRVLRPSTVRDLARVPLVIRRFQELAALGALEGLRLRDALQMVLPVDGDVRVVLLCTFSLLSSMPVPQVLDAPARFFFDKLRVHDDVISPRALWSVQAVSRRTRSYVEALASGFRERVVLGARIRAVFRERGRAVLAFADGREAAFDRVVFACHADEALRLLAPPTPLEARLLGAWRYMDGRVLVHRDGSAFPPRELMQAYTFLYRQGPGGAMETSVNGCLWHEPGTSPGCDLISSQHPNFPVRASAIELDTVLRTPIFDLASVATIPHLQRLNGAGGTAYFCGSYFGYGLHEDAVSSAISVAQRLGSPLA